MQRGLNFGIACWMDAQHGAGGRPAIPTMAIPFTLRHLGNLETPEDLVRAAELALLTNRVDATGWQHDTGGLPVQLWDRHRAVVAGMTTALSTLSSAERDALSRADAVLFKEDGLTISDKFAMYNETRRIHEELILQGASADAVQLAYQNWLTLGHKIEVEEALAAKTSLSRGTSRLLAASDVTRIEIALDSLGTSTPFAPTLFSPLSATSTEHWTEAEVDLQALEESMPPSVPRTEWKTFRGNKNGKVRFRFITVELHRPWFSTELYSADDWRLSQENAPPVSTGDGTTGQLPFYYGRVYLAQILEVRTTTPNPRPQTTRPQLAHANLAAVVANRPQLLNVAHLRPAVVEARPVRPLVRPTVVATRGLKSKKTQTKRGVVARRSNLRINAGTQAHLRVNRPPVVASQLVSRIEAKPHLKIGSVGRIALIQKLSTVSVVNRIGFAQAQLVAPVIPPVTTGDRTTYVVGFGRTVLPACPNPNPNYQWP